MAIATPSPKCTGHPVVVPLEGSTLPSGGASLKMRELSCVRSLVAGYLVVCLAQGRAKNNRIY